MRGWATPVTLETITRFILDHPEEFPPGSEHNPIVISDDEE